MDDIGSGTFPVAFGNFAEGYLLIDRSELRVLRDPYTTVGQVKFYCRQRWGGIPKNNDSIKFIFTS